MRIRDWSSDVCSSDLERQGDCDVLAKCLLQARQKSRVAEGMSKITVDSPIPYLLSDLLNILVNEMGKLDKATSSAPFMRIKGKIEEMRADPRYNFMFSGMLVADRSEEHTSELQSLMRISYAVFCLKKKK